MLQHAHVQGQPQRLNVFSELVLPLANLLRHDVQELVGRVVSPLQNRIFPFDSDAARAYAGIAASRRVAGRPIAEADCQVATITRSRGMTLATRDVRDFEAIGIDILDPWTAP